MEFKGTKDKWRLEQSLFYDTDKIILSDTKCICRVTIDGEEAKSNALLISKAPEMLEMLKKVLEINKHHNFNGHLINEQIEQLIKEATEI